jgi:hypothetical protein
MTSSGTGRSLPSDQSADAPVASRHLTALTTPDTAMSLKRA